MTEQSFHQGACDFGDSCRNRTSFCRTRVVIDRGGETRCESESGSVANSKLQPKGVETCGMRDKFHQPCLRFVLHLCVLTVPASFAGGQDPDEIIPGTVELKNGMVFSGLCSDGQSLYSLNQPDSRIDLKKIDQGYRRIFVAARQAGLVIPDNSAVPSQTYKIRQKVTRQAPLNYTVGLHENKPFGPDGRSEVVLNIGGGNELTIDIGIVTLDSRFAKIQGLTHRWSYGISTTSIPDDALYPGGGQPGIVNQIEGFEDGDTRLNLVQMLLAGGRFTAAQRLLNDTRTEFPELEQRCERLSAVWSDAVAERLLVELARLQDTGRVETARAYASKWPDQGLEAVVRVRARQFVNEIEDRRRRVSSILNSLDLILGQIEDSETHRQAARLCARMKQVVSVNTLPRFEAFELLSQDSDVPPESRIALAVTGWILGGENAIDEFSSAIGLFDARFLVQDFLRSEQGESEERFAILEQLRGLEGYSAENVSQLIRNLPAENLFRIQGPPNVPLQFEISALHAGTRCVAQVPQEYSPNRRYPLLIAFPRGGATAEVTLRWWSRMAAAAGYILVVPDLLGPGTLTYDASALQHQQLLDLIPVLKRGLSVDDDRVFVAGHGLGAEIAMDFGASHPDLFAGVVSIAGLGRKHLLWTVDNSPELGWYVVAGTRQAHYSTRLLPFLRKMFMAKRSVGRIDYCNAMLSQFPERGFESYASELTDIFKWMDLQNRGQMPEHIDVTTLRSTDVSWWWLQMSSIDDRFATMDGINEVDDVPETRGRIEVDAGPNNYIRIDKLPGKAVVRLSPEIPGMDLGKEIRIRRGSRSQRVTYEPSVRDMLEDFRERRDRKHLCFMKVVVER